MDFPQTAQETKDLALKLALYLKREIQNTNGSAKNWTSRNIALLSKFCFDEGIDPIYSGGEAGPECLWDFMGYVREKGAVITAESEFNTDHDEIAKDFDKLLYANSPIKLMICRIDKKYSAQPDASAEADRIRQHLESQIKGNCTHYPAGSVFIIYCVWWAENGGPNRDFLHILKIDGEPRYVSVRNEQHFDPV